MSEDSAVNLLSNDSPAISEKPAVDSTENEDTNVSSGDGNLMSKPFYDGFYDTTGKINKDALNNLPEHLKDSKDLFGKYNTFEALLGGMANLGKLAGKKTLDPLPDDAPEELVNERNKLLAKINNVPEDKSGYGVKKPDDWPEDVPYDQDSLDGYLDILHKHNASPKLVNELLKFNTDNTLKLFNESNSRSDENLTSEIEHLKNHFGDKYDRSLEYAKRALKTMDIDMSDPLFRNSKAVILASKVGELMGEHSLVSGDSNVEGFKDDRQKALDILHNPQNPLYKAFRDHEDPRHQEAVATRSRLNQSWIESQKASR